LPYSKIWLTDELKVETKEVATMEIQLKVRAQRNNTLIIFFLVWAFCYVLIDRVYPKTASIFFSLRAQLLPSYKTKESIDKGTAIGLVSIGFVVLFINLGYGLVNVLVGNSHTNIEFYKGVVFFTILNLSKIIFSYIVSKVYNERNMFYIQLRYFIGTHTIMVLAIATGLAIIYFSGIVKWVAGDNFVYVIWVLSCFIVVIRILIYILRGLSNRNLYLFSYICAAEIVPIVFSVKFLLM
jgi:hypothetical protein